MHILHEEMNDLVQIIILCTCHHVCGESSTEIKCLCKGYITKNGGNAVAVWFLQIVRSNFNSILNY